MKNGEKFRRIDKLEKSLEIKNDDVDLYDPYPPIPDKEINDQDEIIFENDIQINIEDEDDHKTPVDVGLNEIKYM